MTLLNVRLKTHKYVLSLTVSFLFNLLLDRCVFFAITSQWRISQSCQFDNNDIHLIKLTPNMKNIIDNISKFTRPLNKNTISLFSYPEFKYIFLIFFYSFISEEKNKNQKTLDDVTYTVEWSSYLSLGISMWRKHQVSLSMSLLAWSTYLSIL